MKEKQESLNYDEIVEIEYVGKIQTYDFVIPKTHCFFANDILVHNSSALETIADCVILIYHRIDNESKKMETMLKVAKNRFGEIGEFRISFQGQYYKFQERIEDANRNL